RRACCRSPAQARPRQSRGGRAHRRGADSGGAGYPLNGRIVVSRPKAQGAGARFVPRPRPWVEGFDGGATRFPTGAPFGRHKKEVAAPPYLIFEAASPGVQGTWVPSSDITGCKSAPSRGGTLHAKEIAFLDLLSRALSGVPHPRGRLWWQQPRGLIRGQDGRKAGDDR